MRSLKSKKHVEQGYCDENKQSFVELHDTQGQEGGDPDLICSDKQGVFVVI